MDPDRKRLLYQLYNCVLGVLAAVFVLGCVVLAEYGRIYTYWVSKPHEEIPRRELPLALALVGLMVIMIALSALGRHIFGKDLAKEADTYQRFSKATGKLLPTLAPLAAALVVFYNFPHINGIVSFAAAAAVFLFFRWKIQRVVTAGKQTAEELSSLGMEAKASGRAEGIYRGLKVRVSAITSVGLFASVRGETSVEIECRGIDGAFFISGDSDPVHVGSPAVSLPETSVEIPSLRGLRIRASHPRLTEEVIAPNAPVIAEIMTCCQALMCMPGGDEFFAGSGVLSAVVGQDGKDREEAGNVRDVIRLMADLSLTLEKTGAAKS